MHPLVPLLLGSVNQKPAFPFVVEDRPQVRLIVGGIPDSHAIKVKVLGKEEPNAAGAGVLVRRRPVIDDLDGAQV